MRMLPGARRITGTRRAVGPRATRRRRRRNTTQVEGKSEEDDTGDGGVAAGGGFASAAHTHTHTHTGASRFRRGAGPRSAVKASAAPASSVRRRVWRARRARGFDALDGPSDPSPAPSSHGTVTPANDVSAVSSRATGSPGPDTLLMMQKLKAGRRGGEPRGRPGPSFPGGRPSTFGVRQPLALTPDRRRVRGGSRPTATPPSPGRSAWGGFITRSDERAARGRLPGASHTQTSAGPGLLPRRQGGPRGEARTRRRFWGRRFWRCPTSRRFPAARQARRPRELFPRVRGVLHGRQELRRKSRRESLASAPAPETLPEAFKLVPHRALVEATDSPTTSWARRSRAWRAR